MSIKTLQNGQWVDVYGGIDKETSLANELKLDTTLTQSGLAAESSTVGKRIGNISDLKTDSKDNLVSAINELDNKIGASADIMLVKGEKGLCNSNYTEIETLYKLTLEDANINNPKKIILGLFDSTPAIFRELSKDSNGEPIAIFYTSDIDTMDIRSIEFFVYSDSSYKTHYYTYFSPINDIENAEVGRVIYVEETDDAARPRKYGTMNISDFITGIEDEVFVVDIDVSKKRSNYSPDIIYKQWKKNKAIIFNLDNQYRYLANYITSGLTVAYYPTITNGIPQIVQIRININQSVDIFITDIPTLPSHAEEDSGKFLSLSDNKLVWNNAISDIVITFKEIIEYEEIENEDGTIIEQEKDRYLQANYSSGEIYSNFINKKTVICKYDSRYYWPINLSQELCTFGISYLSNNLVFYKIISIADDKKTIIEDRSFAQIPVPFSNDTYLHYNGEDIVWDTLDFSELLFNNLFSIKLSYDIITDENDIIISQKIVSNYSANEIDGRLGNHLILGTSPAGHTIFFTNRKTEIINDQLFYYSIFKEYNIFEDKIKVIEYIIDDNKNVEIKEYEILNIPTPNNELDDGKFLCYSGINDTLEWKELSNIFLVNLNTNSLTSDYSSIEIYQNFLSGKIILLTTEQGYYILPDLIKDTGIQFKFFEKNNNNIFYYWCSINKNKEIQIIDFIKNPIIPTPAEEDYNKILTYTENGIGWEENEASVPIPDGIKVGQTIVVNKVDENNIPIEWIAQDLPESGIPIPESAKVGQLISVSEINENGKPIKWEVIDFPEISSGIAVEKAEIGQIIIVKSIDSKGCPTEWEAIDIDEIAIPKPELARVGQTIVVNKVDENGIPTEWIVTDFPESSGNVTIDTVATVGQMIVVSEVDSESKPIKWQAINIPQSDYEQPNLIHNEFIKNRPFYKNINILFDDNIETKLINSKTLNSILINEYSTILNLNINFVENEKYQITLKNRLIEEVAVKETGIVSPLRNCIYIGNPRLYLEYYYFKNVANNTSWDDILIEYPAYIAAKTALPNNGKDYLFVYNGTQTLFFTDSPLSTHLYIRQSNLIIDEDYSVLFQSDWEQQNNLSYNYIKNKPFGDEHYIEIIPAIKEGTTSPWTFADFTIDTENNQINFTNPQNEETWIQVKQQPSSNISINLTAADGTVTTYTLEPSAYKEVDEYYAYYGNLYLFDNNYPKSDENFCLFIKSERTNTITDIFSSEKVRAISEMVLKFSSDYVIDNATAIQISQTTIDKIDTKYLSGEIVKKLVTFPANEGQYLKVEEVDNHGFVTRLGTYDNIEIPSFNLNNYLGLLSGGFEIDGGPKTTNANDEIGRIRKLLAENVVEISFTIRVGGIGGIIGGEEITFTNIVTPVYVSSTDIYQAFFKSAYNDGYIDVYLTFNPDNTITIELKTSDSFKIDTYNLIELGMPDLILNGNAQTISLDTTNISKIQKSLDKGIAKFVVNLKNPENDEIIQTIVTITGEQQTSYNGYSISQTFIDDSYGVINIKLDPSNSSITASYQQLNSKKQMDDIMNKLRTLANYGFFVEDDGKGNLLIHSRMITVTDDDNGNATVLSGIITAIDDGNGNTIVTK